MSRKKKVNHLFTRWSKRSIPRRSHPDLVSMKQRLSKAGSTHGESCGQKAMSPTRAEIPTPTVLRGGLGEQLGSPESCLASDSPSARGPPPHSASILGPSCATRGQTSHSGGALVSLPAWEWKSAPAGLDGGLWSVPEGVHFANCDLDHLSTLLVAIFCGWFLSLPGFPSGSVVKNLPASAGAAGDAGSIPGLGRSPGGGQASPLQYRCLENPVDRGAWRAAACRVAKTWTCWVT